MNVIRDLARCGYRAMRRRAFAKSLSGDRGSVIFAGDSIIQGWTTLSTDFPDLKAVNRGINGETSVGLILRLEEDILACHPKAVVILIGTNDLSSGVAPRRIAAFIRRIADKIGRSGGGIPVVLCHILPRRPEPGRFPAKIRELNALIDRLAQSRVGLRVCDSFTPLAAADGGHRESCFVDGLHLSPEGYRELTAALAPHLATY